MVFQSNCRPHSRGLRGPLLILTHTPQVLASLNVQSIFLPHSAHSDVSNTGGAISSEPTDKQVSEVKHAAQPISTLASWVVCVTEWNTGEKSITLTQSVSQTLVDGERDGWTTEQLTALHSFLLNHSRGRWTLHCDLSYVHEVF